MSRLALTCRVWAVATMPVLCRTRPSASEFAPDLGMFIQAQIDENRKQEERLRDTYVLGDTPRDEYWLLRSGLEKQLRDLERQLGGPHYPLEDTLARVNWLGSLLSNGPPGQQKRALALLFSRISVDLTGKITEVEPQPWAQPLLAYLVAVAGDNRCPKGTSLLCRRPGG